MKKKQYQINNYLGTLRFYVDRSSNLQIIFSDRIYSKIIKKLLSIYVSIENFI